MLWADPVAPLVPVSDGLPPNVRQTIIDAAGLVSNFALIATVAAVVIGAILVGAGTVLRRPHLTGRGWQSIGGGILGAVAVLGMSAWIAWWGGHAISAWH